MLLQTTSGRTKNTHLSNASGEGRPNVSILLPDKRKALGGLVNSLVLPLSGLPAHPPIHLSTFLITIYGSLRLYDGFLFLSEQFSSYLGEPT